MSFPFAGEYQKGNGDKTAGGKLALAIAGFNKGGAAAPPAAPDAAAPPAPDAAAPPAAPTNDVQSPQMSSGGGPSDTKSAANAIANFNSNNRSS